MRGYRNPIIPGFHPDPSVCRVGAVYYLATSSFTYFPGVPIFRSSNLVDWTQIGNALDRPSQLDLSGTDFSSSFGVFAPTLRHHDGRFWLITTVFSRETAARSDSSHPEGIRTDNFFVTASDPAGPWSEPIRVNINGIDPDLVWAPDGSCWVHYSNGWRIERVRIDADDGTVLDGPASTWSGIGLQYPEAPHVFEHDGSWYLVIAEGGTERGHAVSIARGPSPEGPWENCPANPILSHRSTASPIQNTGHADLIAAADGSWWMVLLATRPRGMSPLFHVLGRETFLAPVEWVDGWPTVDPITLHVSQRPPGPIEEVAPGSREDFDAPTLHPQWIAVRRPTTEVARLDLRPGWLTLDGDDRTLDDPRPVFIGRRQLHERCLARALVDPGDADLAGLAIRMDERSHYEIAVTGDRVEVSARIGPLTHVVAEAPRPGQHVVLSISTAGDIAGPDVIRLGCEGVDGAPRLLAELDGRFLSTEVAGGMLGRVIGMYAIGGPAAFDWFDYAETPHPETARIEPS
jgi:xylan 1,4-beta-xylosidase